MMIWEDVTSNRCLEVLRQTNGPQVAAADADKIFEALSSAALGWDSRSAKVWATAVKPLSKEAELWGAHSESPYVVAPAAYSEVFRNHLRLYHSDQLVGRSALNTFTCWHRDRILSVSKYALHVSWAESGLPYQKWIERFTSTPASAWSNLFSQFPVLLRLVHTVDSAIRFATEEVFQRLASDRAALFDVFGAGGAITQVSLGMSDPHRGGRTVMRFVFENGCSLIYKPKPLDIDKMIHEFSAQSPVFGRPGLVPVKVLTREGYGWMKDVGPFSRDNVSPKSIGRVAALFWLLNATDLHSENICGSGDGLVALDMETLLTAPLFEPDGAPDLSWRSHSLLTTQLTQISYGSARRPNISGLFPEPALGLLSQSISFDLEGDKVTVRRVAADRRNDDETVKGREPRYQATEIVTAFKTAIDEGRMQVREFVETIPADTETRLVLRDTVFYERVLERLRQPRFLRDGHEFSKDLLKLFSAEIDSIPAHDQESTQLNAIQRRVVADEIAQLVNGDVPYFGSKIGSRDILLSNGRIESAFTRSGADWSLSKIKNLGPSDIKEQSALLALSLKSVQTYGDLPSTPAEALACAAENLADEAFVPDDSPARWLGTVGDATVGELHVSPGLRDLFSGSLGVTLAIEVAVSVSGRGPKKFLDREALAWREHFESSKGKNSTIPLAPLGFEGLGGVILAVAELVSISPNRWSFFASTFLDHIEKLEDKIVQAIALDNYPDVIGGSAGLLLGLSRLGETLESYSQIEKDISLVNRLRLECGLQLANKLRLSEGTASWLMVEGEQPSLSFAHGWAGAIAALDSLRDKDDVRISSALSLVSPFASLCFERDGAWLDYRGDLIRPLNRSWCNGSAGLVRGLFAAGLSSRVPSEKLEQLILEVQSQVGSSGINRFCCGEMGVVDLLLDLRMANYPGLSAATSDIRDLAFDKLRDIWKDSGEVEGIFPSLFQGRSGALFTAARSMDPSVRSLSGQNLLRISDKASPVTTS